ncbi:MAG: serine hydrolase, partial [Armatimonadetes bacterium]|nr:serine hydrolase [Armatimonadota bacterium]
MYARSRFAFFIGSLYLLSAYTLPASAQSPDIAPKLAKIEETLNKKYKELHIPGVAIAIVKDDKIIFSKGFGLRNVEAKLPVTPSTLFAIGSSTKAFTATSLMMSVEEKRVGLE